MVAFRKYILYVKNYFVHFNLEFKNTTDLTDYKEMNLKDLSKEKSSLVLDVKSKVNVLKLPAVKEEIAKLKDKNENQSLFALILGLSTISGKLDIGLNSEK